MAPKELIIHKKPHLNNPRLLVGLSGWMNGGDVSTGTVRCIIDKLQAEKFAEIESRGFYIYSFPGSMEITSLFRPHTKITEGEIKSYSIPENEFYFSEQDDLIIFSGKEPNLQWEEYADCIYSLCEQFNVKMIYFIGSITGLVPHTREPRLFCSVSNPKLKDIFRHYGISFTNYEGPASIISHLTANCSDHNLDMVSFVATVPVYVQGSNPKCIEAMTRRISGMLELNIDLDDLQNHSDEFEKKLTEAVQEQPELAGNINKLEEDYDNEIFNHEMVELKHWLEQQGIRVD
ncbi:proteasome assembly chaperone family protein [Planctomycetota bacterium]